MYGTAKTWEKFKLALADQVYHETIAANLQEWKTKPVEIGNISIW